jgi:hypothetical protein
MKNPKTSFQLKITKIIIAALAVGFQCLMKPVHAEGVIEAGSILNAVSLVKDVMGGTSAVASQMVVFDKTYTRKYFGVLVRDKYLMNVFQNGKVVFKHTYTCQFPNQKTPLAIESKDPWDYNVGNLTMGDHQIEVRDYVCQQGDSNSGATYDLKVSFTMGVRWQSDQVKIFPTRAKVMISGWDQEPADCTGWPTFNVGDKIDWSSQILPNGEAQVLVTPRKPSFTLNRSYGKRGSMAVTCD